MIGTLIAAAGAFLGATIAQVTSHFLLVRRETKARDLKAKQLFDAVKEELRLALRESHFLVSGIENIETEKKTYRFNSDPAGPPFLAIVLPHIKVDDPINPRVLVVLSMAYAELSAVSKEVRALGNRRILKKNTAMRTFKTFDYILSVYAAFMKASDSDHIPHSFEVTEDDKTKALTLIGLVDDEAFLKVPNLDDLAWVHIDESKIQHAEEK